MPQPIVKSGFPCWDNLGARAAEFFFDDDIHHLTGVPQEAWLSYICTDTRLYEGGAEGQQAWYLVRKFEPNEDQGPVAMLSRHRLEDNIAFALYTGPVGGPARLVDITEIAVDTMPIHLPPEGQRSEYGGRHAGDIPTAYLLTFQQHGIERTLRVPLQPEHMRPATLSVGDATYELEMIELAEENPMPPPVHLPPARGMPGQD